MLILSPPKPSEGKWCQEIATSYGMAVQEMNKKSGLSPWGSTNHTLLPTPWCRCIALTHNTNIHVVACIGMPDSYILCGISLIHTFIPDLGMRLSSAWCEEGETFCSLPGERDTRVGMCKPTSMIIAPYTCSNLWSVLAPLILHDLGRQVIESAYVWWSLRNQAQNCQLELCCKLADSCEINQGLTGSKSKMKQ